jgi:glucose-6-phosphate isomerase
MQHLSFSYQHSNVSAQKRREIARHLQPTITHIHATAKEGYETDYASLFAPFDAEQHAKVQQIVQAKKSLNPSLLIIIGIGGSHLGILAVEQAIRGVFHNYYVTMPVFYADSVDANYTQSLYHIAEQTLKKKEIVLITIISKSGTTTETIANAQLFTKLLARYHKKYQDYVVIITDQESPLWVVAQQHGITSLAVPAKIGGRFSLFSPVGLFPLGMLDIDTEQLLAGARCVYEFIQNFDNNPAAISAAILYAQYQNGLIIHDSFLFSAQLEALGKWYRQLLAESIGKAKDRDGQIVHIGITPTVSIGSADLHSVAQLYLAGPNNRVTTFIAAQEKADMKISEQTPFDQILPMIQGKTYDTLMHAMLDGVKKVYEHEKRPFMSFELPEISAYYIGQFMQLKMLEIMYLGALFNINPFDQPQVELYKQETRKILAHD